MTNITNVTLACDDDWQKGAHKVMEHAEALNVAKNVQHIRSFLPNYTILDINSSHYSKVVQVKKVYIFVD